MDNQEYFQRSSDYIIFNSNSDRLDNVISKIVNAKSIVILQGAGVSVASGIPDYRSKNGIFAKYGENVFQKSTFLKDPQLLYNFKKEWWSQNYNISEGHNIGKHLYKLGNLKRIYTQNVDGLQYQALMNITDEDKINDLIVEFHGNNREAHCAKCYEKYSIDIVKNAINHNTIAYCSECRGPIKPATVLYGEKTNVDYFNRAVIDLRGTDLVIVMGTSLKVFPFAMLMGYIYSHIIVLNNEIPEGYPSNLVPITTFIIGDIEEISKYINKKLGNNQ